MLKKYKIKAALAFNTERGHLFPGFQARYLRRAGTSSVYRIGMLNASLPEKRKHRFSDTFPVFFPHATVIVFSFIINGLIKSIQSFKAHTIQQITLCPHSTFLPIWRKWFLKFQFTMPRHHKRWRSGAEWHNSAQTVASTQPWGNHHDGASLHNFWHSQAMKITHQYCARIWMKIYRHRIRTLTKFTTYHNEFQYA